MAYKVDRPTACAHAGLLNPAALRFRRDRGTLGGRKDRPRGRPPDRLGVSQLAAATWSHARAPPDGARVRAEVSLNDANAVATDRPWPFARSLAMAPVVRTLRAAAVSI